MLLKFGNSKYCQMRTLRILAGTWTVNCLYKAITLRIPVPVILSAMGFCDSQRTQNVL